MTQTQPTEAPDARQRALIAARHCFTFALSAVVSLGYALLIGAMAYLPGALGLPLWPDGGISVGLFASFLYALLSIAAMRVWLRRRTSDSSARRPERGAGPDDA